MKESMQQLQAFGDSVAELIFRLMIRAKWIDAIDVENVTEIQMR